MSTLYMKCTTDKYELPIAVADSCAELARMLGINVASVYSMISKEISGYHKIDFPEAYPDNDGQLWYKDPETRQTVYVED